MLIPTITPELAAQAPNPEFAWTLRPKQETEPMYRNGRINLKNYCMRVEYDILKKKLGKNPGDHLPDDVKKKWERDMIEKYDPVTFAFLYMFEQIGASAC